MLYEESFRFNVPGATSELRVILPNCGRLTERYGTRTCPATNTGIEASRLVVLISAATE